MRCFWVVVVAWGLVASGCGRDLGTDMTGGANVAKMTLTSTAFGQGQAIPRKFTGEGKDVSPPLAWGDAPAGTKQVALIMDDPDAPTEAPFVHWVMCKIAAEAGGLAEGAGKNDAAGVQGKNSFGKTGYDGPMPPPRHGVHRYYIRVYALDQPVGLGAGASKEALLAAMKGHVLGMGELMGTYERK